VAIPTAKEMTKKDYFKIAECLRNYKAKQKEMENSGDGFDEMVYLIDEFSYMLKEDNQLFNEVEFKEVITK